MRFSFYGEEDVVVGHLQSAEFRDNGASRRANISKVENNVSDDEAN